MNYIQHMIRVLKFQEDVYREIITNNKLSLWYTSINVSILGIIYGLSSIHFSRYILSHEISEDLSSQIKLMIVLIGVSLSFLIHGALSLFVWVFSRGFGGSTFFLPVYLALGIAYISLWPLAPALAAFQVKIGGTITHFYSLAAILYGVAVMFHAIKSASGLPFNRMLVVIAVVIIYIGCFMYLWAM